MENNYLKTDIYKLLNVPEEKQGGKWDKGYTNHNNFHFIFANIKTSGKGYDGSIFDYNNYFLDKDTLYWEGAKLSRITHPSIVNLIKSHPLIFVRYSDTTKPYWIFLGTGKAIKVRGKEPVVVHWEINKVKLEDVISKSIDYELLIIKEKYSINPFEAFDLFKKYLNDRNLSTKKINEKFEQLVQ